MHEASHRKSVVVHIGGSTRHCMLPHAWSSEQSQQGFLRACMMWEQNLEKLDGGDDVDSP